ncbi:hypothetical protein [Niallia sp. RD1]|uniref:hypothetical protein n=1 Tax=Niallia sp. RD1 TaxID=2962858 RepID=UPI0020C1AC56|nr:hypothetical protein [Niallia sp. RD1]UTI43910.1 hypothetical protein NKG37_09845 [Niallia sp. RD1]
MRKVFMKAMVLNEAKNTKAGFKRYNDEYVIEVSEENLNPEYLCNYAWEQGQMLMTFEIIDEESIDFGEDIALSLNATDKAIVSTYMASVETVYDLEEEVKYLVGVMNQDPPVDLDNNTYYVKYERFGNNGILIEQYAVQMEAN